MNKLLFAGVSIAVFAVVLAQEPEMGGKASQAYREYRETISKPTYGLKKVESLLKKHKLKDSTEDGALPAKEYKKLTTKERFTYHMLHGEAYAQNCEAMPVYADEEKRIWAYPPGAFTDERGWSEDQMKTISANRKAFIPLIKSTIQTQGRVGCNLKQAIIDLNAYELIPTLSTLYKKKRYDHDILSVLMILMKEGKYQPFMKSTSFQKLYSESASYQAFLVANRENQDLIMSRAAAYYKTK